VLEKHLKVSRERFDVGESTRTDVSQSEARFSRAKSDAIQAEGNVTSSEAAFEQVMGYKPAQELVYPNYTPTIPNDAKETTNVALKQNPRIIAAKYTEDASDDGVGVNIARILPEVSLRGSMNRTEGASVSSIDFDTDAVLLDVNIPLYQGGAEYARVREAKTIKSRRRYELLQTTNEVREQSISAWEQYQTSVAAIASQRDVIKAAEVAVDGVQQELLYGTRTQLDVLDAQQELFVAKVNLERSERTRMVSMYNLLAVTGRLSPANLKLGISDYDNEKAIDEVKYQFIGF
jgi:outer membrane protein